jgi:Mitochondrial ribosomal protein subunit
MGIPLTVPAIREKRDDYRPDTRRSVFDSELDSTTANQSSKEENRWKFKGPWLAGQTEGEFNTYVVTEVRNRKLEFQNFIRSSCAKALTQEARRIATAAGESEEKPPTLEASDVTEEQLTEFVKTLRTERIALYKLIRSFLDLPPAPLSPLSDRLLDWMTASLQPQAAKGTDLMESQSPYAETGPPKTHPSAGLAYSRTSQYIYNHPVFGPQKNKAPVKARIVMPRGAATGSFAAAAGVGGFVTETPGSGFKDDFRLKRSKKAVIPGAQHIEPDKVGGSKFYANPTHARIDPKGRVLLNIELADEDSVAVLEGTTDQLPSPLTVGPGTVERSVGFRPTLRSRESSGYGLNYELSDRGEAPRPNYPTKSPNQEDATRALKDLLDEQ